MANLSWVNFDPSLFMTSKSMNRLLMNGPAKTILVPSALAVGKMPTFSSNEWMGKSGQIFNSAHMLNKKKD